MSSESIAEHEAPALPNTTPNGSARLAALRAVSSGTRTPTSLIAYRSRDRLLVMGPEPYALEQAQSLSERMDCTVLALGPHGGATAASADLQTQQGVRVVHGDLVGVAGHLGQFTVSVSVAGKEVDLAQLLGGSGEHFDLVLDLARPPSIRRELLPPGYYAPDRDRDALYRALAEIPEMVGEFERPKYFDYDPEICAHGERGLTGCTRCIDVCPSGALSSAGERISIDSYLCHGVGSCATACPTGAIRYAFPKPGEVLEQIRLLLSTYHSSSGAHPLLLFHDTGQAQLPRIAADMPEWVIPVEIEEVGSVGMEIWLGSLAYGAAGIGLLTTESTSVSVREELEKQVGYASDILQGLGYRAQLIRLMAGEDAEVLSTLSLPVEDLGIEHARFAVFDEKRTMLQMALDHLYAQTSSPQSLVSLAAGAPFGEIQVDTKACTLCMACVSVCPASALSAGAEAPQLSFIEWNCVQCGLCETACPEDAISLAARMVLEPDARRKSRVLNEEPPFFCIVCGTPFATRSLVDTMTERLKGHHMFQDDALKRIQMCGDCRVKDMYVAEQKLDQPGG